MVSRITSFGSGRKFNKVCKYCSSAYPRQRSKDEAKGDKPIKAKDDRERPDRGERQDRPPREDRMKGKKDDRGERGDRDRRDRDHDREERGDRQRRDEGKERGERIRNDERPPNKRMRDEEQRGGRRRGGRGAAGARGDRGAGGGRGAGRGTHEERPGVDPGRDVDQSHDEDHGGEGDRDDLGRSSSVAYDRDRSHGSRGRGGQRGGQDGGREFVRGRGGRGRSGYSTVRGGRGRGGEGGGRGGGRGSGSGSGNQEYRSYERSGRYPEGPQPSGPENQKMAKSRQPGTKNWADSEHSEGEEYPDTRRRTRGEESDVSLDEASASISESSSERASESREASKVREPHQEGEAQRGKDPSRPQRGGDRNGPVQDQKNEYGRDRDKGGATRGGKGEQREPGQYKPPRENKRGDKGEKNSGGPRSNSAAFVPRGEPSRRGRGSGVLVASRGRGGRYFSAPPRPGGNARSPRSQNGDKIGEGKPDENKENKSNPPRRDYKWDRNAPPPRFARSTSAGRGRGAYQERGRGRGRGRGGSMSASRGGGGHPGGGHPGGGRDGGPGVGGGGGGGGGKKPQLTKQNSSDLANEEWETASESSDVLDRRERGSKNDLRDQGKDRERREAKKSFSGQRPVNDRQNRRATSAEARKSSSLERMKGPNKERSPNANRANGGTPNSRNSTANNTKNNKTLANASKKENVNSVYRVDEIVHQDPTAIQNAINSLNSK